MKFKKGRFLGNWLGKRSLKRRMVQKLDCRIFRTKLKCSCHAQAAPHRLKEFIETICDNSVYSVDWLFDIWLLYLILVIIFDILYSTGESSLHLFMKF